MLDILGDDLILIGESGGHGCYRRRDDHRRRLRQHVDREGLQGDGALGVRQGPKATKVSWPLCQLSTAIGKVLLGNKMLIGNDLRHGKK